MGGGMKSPKSVKDLAGRFEQMSGSSGGGRGSPRMSPRPSPSNSIKSLKVRGKASSASLARQTSIRSARERVSSKGKEKDKERWEG
jgi:hypothetical protein